MMREKLAAFLESLKRAFGVSKKVQKPPENVSARQEIGHLTAKPTTVGRRTPRHIARTRYTQPTINRPLRGLPKNTRSQVYQRRLFDPTKRPDEDKRDGRREKKRGR